MGVPKCNRMVFYHEEEIYLGGNDKEIISPHEVEEIVLSV